MPSIYMYKVDSLPSLDKNEANNKAILREE